jgi:hypothetical protein
VFHSLEEWARTGPSRCESSLSQASAHVARHDGAAGRRKTARREEVVSSVDERSALGATRSVVPWPVRRGLVAKARAGAVLKRENA